jgi:ABC-type lipoprotein export system ATPase subunit
MTDTQSDPATAPEVPTAGASDETALPPALDVSGIVKSYQLGKENIPVLQGLSLRVDAGELVAIMGPSGSGKTTLLNCIAAIDTPDEGDIALAGTPVDYGSERSRTLLRRRDIGIVFQFFNLIPTLNVRENIALPQRISGAARAGRDARVDDLLRRIGLNERATHLPHQLSGGEMQLVSIARALVHRPALLLADEPTGNVNPAIGRSILQTLRDTVREENTSVLLVTHSPEHAAWADRICFLKDGVIAGSVTQTGGPENLAPIYAELQRLGI